MQYQERFSPARARSRVGTMGLALLLALWPAAAALAGGGAPDTQFTQVEPDPTNDTTGDFAFTATILNSTFECSVDSAAFAACPTPFHTAVLADGTHVLQVRAKEPGGIVDPTPAEHTWRVDTVRPDTTITSGPSGGVTVDTATFTFESTEVDSIVRVIDIRIAVAAYLSGQLRGVEQRALASRVRAEEQSHGRQLNSASLSDTLEVFDLDCGDHLISLPQTSSAPICE